MITGGNRRRRIKKAPFCTFSLETMYTAGMNAAGKAIFPHGIAAGSAAGGGEGLPAGFLGGGNPSPEIFSKSPF